MSNDEARRREEAKRRASAERARYAQQERLKAEERKLFKEKQAKQAAERAEQQKAVNEQYSTGANAYGEKAVYTNENPTQKTLARPALNNRFGPSFTGPAKTSPNMQPKTETAGTANSTNTEQNKPAEQVRNIPKLDRHFKF